MAVCVTAINSGARFTLRSFDIEMCATIPRRTAGLSFFTVIRCNVGSHGEDRIHESQHCCKVCNHLDKPEHFSYNQFINLPHLLCTSNHRLRRTKLYCSDKSDVNIVQCLRNLDTITWKQQTLTLVLIGCHGQTIIAARSTASGSRFQCRQLCCHATVLVYKRLRLSPYAQQ